MHAVDPAPIRSPSPGFFARPADLRAHLDAVPVAGWRVALMGDPASGGNLAGFTPTGVFGGEGWVRRVSVVASDATMRQVRELTVAYMRKLPKGIVVRAVASFSKPPFVDAVDVCDD